MATPVYTRGTTGEGTTTTSPCGCVVSERTRSAGRRVAGRCEEGERLWGELRSARDEMNGSGRGVGHKIRIDAFARARDEFHRHVFGGV